jgi:hypothetical protein
MEGETQKKENLEEEEEDLGPLQQMAELIRIKRDQFFNRYKKSV